jgi:SAF domain
LLVRTSPSPPSRTTPAVGARDKLRVAPAIRRRSLPWALAGLLLVVVCALVFAVASSRLGHRQAVLAIAHAVPTGHLIDHSDLAVVQVSLDPGLRPIAASAQAAVVGRPAAVPLLPGTLLTEAALGAPSVPRPGEAVVGLALKPGQFPPQLAAGARVLAAETGPEADPAAPAVSGGSPRTHRAMVVAVTVPAAEGATGEADEAVVSLKLAAAVAPRIAAAGAAGRVVLVLVASEGS